MKGIGSVLIKGTIPAFAQRYRVKPRKISVRIPGLRAEIWTLDLPNTKQESAAETASLYVLRLDEWESGSELAFRNYGCVCLAVPQSGSIVLRLLVCDTSYLLFQSQEEAKMRKSVSCLYQHSTHARQEPECLIASLREWEILQSLCENRSRT
jgi:hypothetical protein